MRTLFFLCLFGLFSIYGKPQCSVNIATQGAANFCNGNTVNLVATATASGPVEVIDQSNNWTPGLYQNIGGLEVWQTFTAGETGLLTKIGVKFYGTGSIYAQGTLKVFQGNLPYGTPLDTRTVTLDCLNSCLCITNVAVSVTAGTEYTFQLYFPGYSPVVEVDTDGHYAGGSYNGGPNDLMFYTYVSAYPDFTYQWSSGSGNASTTVSSNGNYIVTATASFGGCTATDTLNVTFYQQPSVAGTPSGTTLLCQNSANTVYTTTGATNAGTYQWHIYPVGAGTVAGTGTNGTVGWNPNFSGTAYIKVKGINGACEGLYSDSIPITVLPAPVSTITPAGPTSFCQGNTVVLNASAGSNYTYQWQLNGINMSSATNISLTASQTGNYTVVTTGVNGCSAVSSPVTVTVNPFPIANITPSGSTTFCQGGAVTLSANTGTGLTYQWQKNNTNITGAIGVSCNASQSGDYTVITTNSFGCSSTSSPVTVTVVPFPSTFTITASGSTTFCLGGSVTLTSNPASSYNWSTGEAAQSIVVTSSGEYTVTVNNSCGNAVLQPVTVTVNEPPSAPYIDVYPSTTFCPGETLTLCADPSPSYQWNTGATTQCITVIGQTEQQFTVTVSNSCGNAVSPPRTITPNPAPPTPVITQSGNILNSSSSTGNQWYLNGSPVTGATGQAFAPASNGLYTVEVTNTYGCTAISAAYNFISTSVSEITGTMNINVYPNPASQTVYIESAKELQEAVITIYNTSSQVQIQEPLKQKITELNISNLSSGIYFLKIQSIEGVRVWKVIKK